MKYAAGEVAVKLRAGAKSSQLRPLFDRFHSKIKQDFDQFGWGWIEVADSVNVIEVISELKKSSAVEIAEPDFVMHVHVLPNDPYFNGTSPATYAYQWALRNTGQVPPGGTTGADIDATNAWNLTTGSSNVIIAILDSGIPMLNGSLCHPDLSNTNRIVLGQNYAGGTEGDRDLYGHGTHVTGIAASETNNSTGIAGIAWNCKVLVVRVFDGYGWGYASWFYNGVHYAVDYVRNNPGYKMVINYSGGGDADPSGVMESAVSYANTYGVTIVASAGNNNGEYVRYPAAYSSSYSNVIAVSATDQNDVVASYSNIGSQVNISAPGGWGVIQDGYVSRYNTTGNLGRNVFSTTPNYSFNMQTDPVYPGDPYSTDVTQNYGYMPGTSMAAPQVSGTVALLLSTRPSLTPSQIRSTLELSADDKGANGKDDYYGYGRLNANATVRNLYVPQVYSTVASAVSAAISGQTVVVSSGSYSITTNLTVPSGVTLQLNSGATLSFSSGITFTVNGALVTNSSLSIPLGTTMNVGAGAALKFASGTSLLANGRLQVNGTSVQHVIVTSTEGTSEGSWGSITISGNPASGSNINYADISYGTKISVINATGVTIQNCTLTKIRYGIDFEGPSATYCSALSNKVWMPDYSTGIMIGNGANVTVNENVVKEINLNKNGNGIFFIQANGYIGRNDVAYCNSGILSTWSSSPYAYSPFSSMRNNRVTNCNYGLVAYERSYPVFGTTPPSDFMWNSVHDNYLNAVVGSYTYSPASMLAQGNWWGGTPNPSMFLIYPAGYLSYTPYLSSDPWSGIPLPSVREAPGSGQIVVMPVSASLTTTGASGPAQAEYVRSGSSDSLLTGIDLLVQHKNKDAMNFFLSYIERHPDDQAAYGSLYNCADSVTTDKLIGFFKNLPVQADKAHELLLPFLLLKTGDIRSAREVNNRIAGIKTDTLLALRARLNNFYISLYYENDPRSAALILKDVMRDNNKLSASMELSAAQTALATYVDPQNGSMPYSNNIPSDKGLLEVQPLQEEGLVQNYPNPFNPTTTIHYRLPSSGRVELRVYDVLGRELIVLVNSYQEAGVHTAYFNGRDLASGIYFYRLTAPGVNQVNKMLLMK